MDEAWTWGGTRHGETDQSDCDPSIRVHGARICGNRFGRLYLGPAARTRLLRANAAPLTRPLQFLVVDFAETAGVDQLESQSKRSRSDEHFRSASCEIGRAHV